MDGATTLTQLEGGPASVQDSYAAMDQPAVENGFPSSDGRDGPPQTPVTMNGDGSAMQTDDVSNAGTGEGGAHKSGHPDRVIKPNKVYVGGLPEHTRVEDLQSCFGKIGNIVNIELKVGYGFVEFDSREAAEESVAKYHEGFFMGNKIRVEQSRGGRSGRHGAAGNQGSQNGEPGPCFKCGQVGHWARECTNVSDDRRNQRPPGLDGRRDFSRRDVPRVRDDFGPPGGFPPPRDARYPPPPRDYRDYPGGPPPLRGPPPPREFDDYRRGVPPPPVGRYDRPAYYAEPPGPPGFDRPYPPLPPPRDAYDRYDRRGPPPSADRYGAYPPPPAVRPRTPPGIPPRRDDYDRPPRDYPPPGEYRGRPPSPPPGRYGDYPPRTGPPPPPGASPRYRRRSQSPPPRSGGPPYDGPGYPGPPRDGFPGGYAGGPPPPPRGGGGARDYPPPRR